MIQKCWRLQILTPLQNAPVRPTDSFLHLYTTTCSLRSLKFLFPLECYPTPFPYLHGLLLHVIRSLLKYHLTSEVSPYLPFLPSMTSPFSMLYSSPGHLSLSECRCRYRHRYIYVDRETDIAMSTHTHTHTHLPSVSSNCNMVTGTEIFVSFLHSVSPAPGTMSGLKKALNKYSLSK